MRPLRHQNPCSCALGSVSVAGGVVIVPTPAHHAAHLPVTSRSMLVELTAHVSPSSSLAAPRTRMSHQT
jgi:hypothetical protein